VVDELAFKKKQQQINQEIKGDFVQDSAPPPSLEGQSKPEDPAAAFKSDSK
jgi:hypothetical protein